MDFAQGSNMNKTRIVSVTLLSLAANLALAAGGNDQGQNNRSHNDQGHDQWHDQWHDHGQWHDQRHDQRAVSAPEIDPGQAMGALVLLGGAVAIIRGYRRKK